MDKSNNEKKPHCGRSIVTAVLFVFFAAVFVFSLWQLISAAKDYQIGSESYDSLAQTMVTKKAPEAPSPAPAPVKQPELPEQAPAQPREPLLDVDFEALLEMNPHTVAWIYSENEEINYPVVQGSDNDYYLDHLFDGTQNKNGAIFMDCRNSPDLTHRNTLIYGHNMGNHTMFASLVNYGDQAYYDENPVLILETPEASYYLEAFSGYTTKSVSEAYRQDLAEDETYVGFLERIRENSDFESDVEVGVQDRIVTLSTCSYRFDNARYVLHCKLVCA